MKILEINQQIEAALKKFDKLFSKEKHKITVNGKTFSVELRKMESYVHLCLPSKCDASGNCCHYFSKEGIGFCRYDDSKYDVMYNGSVILTNMSLIELDDYISKINELLKNLFD